MCAGPHIWRSPPLSRNGHANQRVQRDLLVRTDKLIPLAPQIPACEPPRLLPLQAHRREQALAWKAWRQRFAPSPSFQGEPPQSPNVPEPKMDEKRDLPIEANSSLQAGQPTYLGSRSRPSMGQKVSISVPKCKSRSAAAHTERPFSRSSTLPNDQRVQSLPNYR